MDWIQSSDVIPMFPTLAWKFQIKEEMRPAVEAAMLAVVEKERPEVALNQASSGWQSARDLHVRKELAAFVAYVDRAAASILRFLRVESGSLVFTGCWANTLPSGAAHGMHAHPNNFLSGVYYVRTAIGANTINFHDPRVQTGIIRPPVVELTAENADLVVVTVADGTLLLFPSWLPHSVETNRSCADRISISFNLMFRSFAEEVAPPLW